MIIREIELFEGMDEAGIETELSKIMESFSVEEGQAIIHEGDPADYFYILQSGELEVSLAGKGRGTHTANRPGEAVGWSSLAGRETYSADVVSRKPSKLVRIHKEKFDVVMRTHPLFGLLFYKRLSRSIGERLIQSYQLLEEKG